MTNMKCPSPSLLIDFHLKSILFDIKITTLACFLGPFHRKTFSQSFTLKECLSLRLWCISISELSPLMLSDINDQ